MSPACTLVCAVAALSFAAPAHAAQQAPTRDEFVAALKQRDAVITALQARVERLEQERVASAAPVAVPPASPALPAIGDDEALQALSGTLVQRGGLVLPPGRIEIVPSSAYSNRIVQGLALVQTPEGIPTVADQRLREDRMTAALGVRVGLPHASQLDVQLPYSWLRTARSISDGSAATNSASGIGDLVVGLSHQFVAGKGARPSLIGGVSWRFRTGRDPLRVPIASVATGSGANEIRGRLTALTVSDPLVFFGTLSYAHELARNESFGRVEGGDSLGLDLGAVLAVNPETSMTFGLSQQWQRRTRVDGASLPGTDSVSSSFDLGLGRVLTPRLLLDLSLGVGLTRDAPDYVFRLSLPFRLR